MKNETVAKLFAGAAGRCSICKTELFVEDVKIGEMAHIIAKSKDGPRGAKPLDGHINGYENLILLCPNDHTVVDGNPDAYPRHRLLDLKRQHEEWVQSSLRDVSTRHNDVAGLNALMRFLPLTHLRSILELLPDTLDVRLVEALSAIEAFPLDFPHCAPFSDPKLEVEYQTFLGALEQLWFQIDGAHPNMTIYTHVEGAWSEKRMVLNRELSHDERRLIRGNVRAAVDSLIPAYYHFLQYLRVSYPEVDVASYR